MLLFCCRGCCSCCRSCCCCCNCCCSCCCFVVEVVVVVVIVVVVFVVVVEGGSAEMDSVGIVVGSGSHHNCIVRWGSWMSISWHMGSAADDRVLAYEAVVVKNTVFFLLRTTRWRHFLHREDVFSILATRWQCGVQATIDSQGSSHCVLVTPHECPASRVWSHSLSGQHCV